MKKPAPIVAGTIRRTANPVPAETTECGARWRKPADEITDRGKRYRANSPECRPPGEPICGFCGHKSQGKPRDMGVHHIDGHEEHVEPENLMYACPGCNIVVANRMRENGLGRKTRQFNPRKGDEGAQTLGQWLTAVMSAKGESNDMNVADAVRLIRATPPLMRSGFAREIWKRRRARR